jgi:hypothetical protein
MQRFILVHGDDGSEFRVQGSRFMVNGSWLMVHDEWLMVQGMKRQNGISKMKSINMGDDKKEKIMIVHGELITD